MIFDILTLFPEMMSAVLNESIIGRAQAEGLVTFHLHNIRNYSEDKHRRVDDYPYGAGGGMVMSPLPIYNAYKSITSSLAYKPLVIYLSPQGRVFDQETAVSLAERDHIILLCGHYEGVDERIIEEIVDMEISIGDFVLTGGELPALTVIDAVCRMLPGVIKNDNSKTESFSDFLLEYPQYTKPRTFLDREVPELLFNGHHAKIEEWRLNKSIERTKLKRPDLYEKYLEKTSR